MPPVHLMGVLALHPPAHPVHPHLHTPSHPPAQGLLLPLAGSGTCTIREAVILSSVINRCSLPVLHSAAALLRLAQMEYSGVTSYFIRILLDKKYALPLKVGGGRGAVLGGRRVGV